MEDKTNIHLTSAEMSGLWSQYLSDSLAVCVNSYFYEKAEDEAVRAVIAQVLKSSEENILILEDLFKKEDFPIPTGFTEEDVNPKAPKLFTDTFFLVYLNQMAQLAMTAGSFSAGTATRPDIFRFQKRVIEKGIELKRITLELMLRQGTYVRPPFISVPDKTDFVKKQQFLNGFFGDKRAVTGVEITHLFVNTNVNSVGKALITGFAQTAENEDVKNYFLRGKKLSQKYIDIFSDFLRKEDLPAPMSWDGEILDSTDKVFSDKLMMYNVSSMTAAGIGNFGMGLAASQRRDIGLRYASLIPEVAFYAEDGANIMIKHGWLEEAPQADDRDALIKKK
ncbi:DUF3231 family protein [Virgibacillus kimchii]